MKLNFNECKEFAASASRLLGIIGAEISEDGIPLRAVKGDRIGVSLSDGTKVYSHQETDVLDRMRLYEGKKVWLFFPARAVTLSVR